MMEDIVRVNDFDRMVGRIQTEKVIELGEGNSILDVGCGIGMYTPMYLKRFKRVVGIDPSVEYLNEARKQNNSISYIEGYGETFEMDELFSTISMNMLIEHVDDPVLLLQNARKHLTNNGVIIIQAPNSESITRRLGVLMGAIPNLNNITEKERDFYGHKRTYTIDTLGNTIETAGLTIDECGGLLYKPLPNEMLSLLSNHYGEEWTHKFIKALCEFGRDKARDCANLYFVCH